MVTVTYLERLPGDTSASGGPVRGAGAVVAADAVDLLDGGDTDGRPKQDSHQLTTL